jgi:Group II intron, maturase-specific domain
MWRSWRLHTRTDLSEADLTRRINPVVRGWMNYYGAFYPSALYPSWRASTPTCCASCARNTNGCGDDAQHRTHGKGREATAPLLRALGLGHRHPRGLVTRTTRAV